MSFINRGNGLKVFLMAGGYGKRLEPLTKDTPKCLLPVKGRPLIEHWFDLFTQAKVTDVLINTHYHADKVNQFIENKRRNGNSSFNIVTAYEPELLGTARTLCKNWEFVKNEDVFLVVYADNYTILPLRLLINWHMQKMYKGIATIGLFKPSKPAECGIVTVKNQVVLDIEEKPERPKSDLGFAGIMITGRKIAKYLDDKTIDIARDLLPKILGLTLGFEIRYPFIDIGTPENYQKAQNL